MPELPDVEIFKQYIDATSLHKTIETVEVKSPMLLIGVSAQKLQTKLSGHKFQSATRYGKYLFVKLDNNFWLILHFGMTGRLKYFKDMEKEPSHDRLLISFANGYHLAYDCQRKLGEVGLTDDIESFVKEKQLGPDVFDLDFTKFKKILEERRGTIKYTLMNQHIMAGIGNIYADEILFQAGLHPETPVNKLDEIKVKELYKAMYEVLKTVVDSQADPEKFPGSYLLPYRRKGGKCPQCDSKLKQIKISGRTTYYCPKCQKK
jgi:formamidopyrimidine-DNA glycosylase